MGRGAEIIAKLRGAQAQEPLYFASGTNSPGPMQAALENNIPFGISIDKCKAACTEWIFAHAEDPRLRLFVDSGAYGEFTGGTKVPDEEWHRRYEQMAYMAEVVGDRASIVLPDKIGDPQESMRRLEEFAPYVKRIVKSGAEPLLPIQKGGEKIDVRAYMDEAAEAAGVPVSALIPSIPLKQKAYTAAQALAVIKALQPRRVHLLGMDVERASKKILPGIRRLSPHTSVSLDSVFQRGKAGMLGRTGDAPSPLTLARYQSELQIDPQLLVRTQIGGPPKYEALIAILAGGAKTRKLQRATTALVDLVAQTESWPKDAALRQEARRFLQGRFPYEDGYFPGSRFNWNYYIDKIGELAMTQEIGTAGRRSGTLSGQVSRLGHGRMIREEPRVYDQSFGAEVDYLLPEGGRSPSIQQVEAALAPIMVEMVPTLTPFGAGQVLRAVVYDNPGRIWANRRAIYTATQGQRDQLTLPELLDIATRFAQRTQKRTNRWTWSSPRLQRDLRDKGKLHPANDLAWFVERMRSTPQGRERWEVSRSEELLTLVSKMRGQHE